MRTFAEDKELEIYLATENIFVDYAEDILVYDEKTSRQEVMARQRSRWFHAQLLAFSLIIRHLDLRTSNWNYMDKAVQWFPLPRILKLIIPSLLAGMSLTVFPLALKWYGLILVSILTYTLAIPRKNAYPEALQEPVEAPFSLLRLDKRIYSLLAPGEGEGHQLQSTPHDITIKIKKIMAPWSSG